MGDFVIPPGPEDMVPPDTMAEYEHGMQVLQFGVDHASSPQEAEQLVGRYGYMMAGIVGFAAETLMSTAEQASTVLHTLEGAGATGDYGVLRVPHSQRLAISLINIKAAERMVRDDETLSMLADKYGYDLGDEPLGKERTLHLVSDLYSKGNSRNAVYAHGVLSGFPAEAAAAYADRVPRDVMPLGFVDPQVIADLTAGRDVERYNEKGMLTEDYSPFQQYDMAPPHPNLFANQDLAKLGSIRGYGVWYRSSVPPGSELSSGEVTHCQQLMQASEQLGLASYLEAQQMQVMLTDSQITGQADVAVASAGGE
jgi:hypothetical protein